MTEEKRSGFGRDPKLDEDFILHMLRAPPAVEHIGLLQGGAAQSLLDMYDRGMTRPEFCEHASKVLALYAQCAKLWLLDNIKAAHDVAPLTAETFKTAHDQLADLIRKQSEEVIEVVKRLQTCPTSEDRVH